MEYYNLLEFNQEPFSNSPEPEFLFASPQHSVCLQRLELAIRLRRGLNIVIGAVGTGKTTLCRKLIQNLSLPPATEAPEIETFLLLDPAVDGRLSFVGTVAAILGIADVSPDASEWQVKEKIKTFLFEKGVQEQKNIVLIIDEGQKIPDECLEILREFLNYETNSYKLLQIIIFAQPEFRQKLAARANLFDRVNTLYFLRPLSFRQTRAMIGHRIAVASQDPGRRPLFTLSGLFAVYLATRGYPRRVVSLCHQVLLMMIIRGKNRAGWFLVRRSVNKMNAPIGRRVAWAALGLLFVAAVLASSFYYLNPFWKTDRTGQSRSLPAGFSFRSALTPTPSASVQIPDPPQPADDAQTAESVALAAESDQTAAEDVSEYMPADLGTITIMKNMTIWKILENIYGDTGQEMTRKFLAANPRITNINQTRQGDVVSVPVIPETARLIKSKAIMVFLQSGTELEPLYYSFIEKKSLSYAPPIRFLSFWNKREGKQFAIALDQRFSSLEEAHQAVQRLPYELALSARVLLQAGQDTVVVNGGSLLL